MPLSHIQPPMVRHSFVFRMTSWFAVFFIVTAIIAFVLFHFFLNRVLIQRTDDELYAQSNELAASFALQGDIIMQRTALMQTQAVGEKKMFFRIFYASGIEVYSSNLSYWKNIGINRDAVENVIRFGRHQFVTQAIPGGKNKGVRVLYRRISDTIILQIGYSLEDTSNMLRTFQQVFLLIMSILFLIAVVLSWFISRRAMARVETVTSTARRISEKDLGTRVPVGRRQDEIDRLAITFNEMLNRIQGLVKGVRQLSDNIAHDLRSPITRIRGLAEVTLTSANDMKEYTHMAASTVEECDRLLDMINTMLTISRTETNVDRQLFVTVDMTAIAQDACELFEPIAEDKHVVLACHASAAAFVSGDRQMLQRLTANLIDNALKYCHSGDAVTLKLSTSDSSELILEVEDTGPGIPEKDQPFVFDRFFRGDQSRSQGGSGLGLSLARAIVKAHGGHISLQSTPGQGSCFTVTLPSLSLPLISS